MLKVNAVLHTDGSGYWTTLKNAVRVIGLELAYVDETAQFGELRVYFDEDTWNINHDGLIYTDKGFNRELKQLLVDMGINSKPEYSEQGMQGEDFVSFDVGTQFISEFTSLAVPA